MQPTKRRTEMSDKITKSPQIRFAGFTEAWEQRRLGDHAGILTGGTPKTSIPEYWEPKEIPWMSSGEVNKRRLDKTDNMISEEGLNNSSARWVKEYSVLIALAGQGKTRGTVAINNIPLTTNQSIAAIVPDETLHYEFIFHNLIKRYDELRMISSGDGTRGGLNKQIVSDVVIPYTSIEEQEKIGTFFAILDNLITLHQRKLNNVKKLKVGLLQKMFPKDGVNVPEIRFAGFTAAWEQRELKELFVKGGSGGTPRSTNKDYYKGEIPFLGISDISNSNGYIDYTKKHISEEGLNNSSAWIVPKGAITLAMYASVGKIAILNVDVATSQAFYNMVFNDIIIRDFIYHRLVKANINEEWRDLISTGTQSNLNAEKVKNFQIQLPKDKSEQSKIGQFFNQLDKIITLHQRELNSLKNLKKSLLHQMFI